MTRTAARILSVLLTITVITVTLVPLLSVSAADAVPLKKRVTFYSEEERANIKENVSKLAWAQAERDGYIKAVSAYVDRGYEFLWNVLTSQGLPRSYGVNQRLGCLSCGKEIDKYGNYPYKYDLLNDPWKLTCPNCGMKFPTNDFKSFYESALDENGNFDASRGDKQYLKNVLYPEKGDTWGVDNGWGYRASNGGLYTFVAYYTHEAIYHYGLNNVIANLSSAYLYSGEQKYADAGIVLLDRMAQIYPAMTIANQQVSDGFLHSHGGGGEGKIMGRIWECSIIRPYVIAYDAFFPAYDTMSQEAKALIAKVSGGKRTTADEMRVHVENGLIKQIYTAVQKAQIYGNQGMHQQTLAVAAVVIDDPTLTKTWMDFNMRPGSYTRNACTGGGLLTVFVNSIDRDGYGYEAAPGYNSLWVNNFLSIAEALRGYKIGGTGESYDLYENVKFKKMIYSFLDLVISGSFTAPTGDTGSTGKAGILANKNTLLSGYLAYGDDYLAQAIYLVNGNSVKDLRLPATEKDPEGIAEKIQKVIDEKGTITLGSVNLTGYGYAVVKSFASYEDAGSASVTKTNVFPFDTLEVLRKSEKENLTFTNREGGHVLFKNDDTGKATVSFGFYLSNPCAVYDLSMKIIGDGKESVLNVFVDGKSLQENVKMSGKSGDETQIIFRKTRELTKGYHVLTLRFVSGDSVGLRSLTALVSGVNQSGEAAVNDETSMYIYYGRNTGHGHADNLNLGLYAYNMDLMPDIGYPEFADAYDMHRLYFVISTVSHNTVVVNKQRQSGVVVSTPVLFDSSDLVKLISVNGSGAYTSASEYKRTTAMIKISDTEHYLVDFFNVTGGTNHNYVLHGAETSGVVTSGLEIQKQTGADGNYVGTMAGKSIGFGKQNLESGYQYFERVRYDEEPSDNFSVDWSIVDTWGTATASDVHLKVTMIGDYNKVTLADATPPTNKPGNPSSLTYLFVEREGKANLKSIFNSVIEPYTGSPKIASAEKVPVYLDGKELKESQVRAVKVTHSSGRIDYVAYNTMNRTKTLSVDGVFEFTGTFAVYSISDSGNVIYTNDAVVTGAESELPGRLTGNVSNFTRKLSTENTVTVTLKQDVDPAVLAGKYVYINRSSSAAFNACYKILSASKDDGGKYVLNIGDVTPIETYLNLNNINSGFRYSIELDKGLYIPIASTSGDPEALYAMAGVSDFSDVTVFSGIKSTAAAGDFISDLYAVNAHAKSAADLVPYKLSVDGEYGDGAMFEVKDNKLYASSSFEAKTGGKYTVRFKAEYENDGKKKSCEKIVTLSTLSKAASESLVYPELDLEPDLAEETPGTPDGPGTEEPHETPDGGVNVWLIVGIAAAVIAVAVIAVLVVSRAKRSKKS